MAGTFAAKVLAEGQLASSKGTLYTVPASTTAYIRWLSCHNTGGSAETVVLYVKPGATSRIIAHASVAASETLYVVNGGESIQLEAGDLIEGMTTTATTVDYVITGVEET